MAIQQQDVVRVRTDGEIKRQVAELSEKLGMNTTTAVNLFFRAFLRTGGLPFDVSLGDTSEEKAEIKRILEQRTKEADDPNTIWLTGDEVKKMIGLV